MDNLSTMKSARIWEQVMETSAASSTYGALPDFLIIGAMKCATTSLLYYLGQHPEIQVSSPKELNFFVAERNWGKGLAWYRSHFQKNIMLRGEASPAYTSYPRYAGVPARIARILPHAKLVYILRDPVKRMVSHFIHRSARGEERRTINEVFGGSDIERYLERSRYGLQLQRYLDHFPIEKIKILTTERLERSRVETLQDLFAFLDVTTDFRSAAFFRYSAPFRGQGCRDRCKERNRLGRQHSCWPNNSGRISGDGSGAGYQPLCRTPETGKAKT
jgi:hypothetical protein